MALALWKGIMLTRKDGPPTPFRNAEYIPFYYFIPKSILSRCEADFREIPAPV